MTTRQEVMREFTRTWKHHDAREMLDSLYRIADEIVRLRSQLAAVRTWAEVKLAECDSDEDYEIAVRACATHVLSLTDPTTPTRGSDE